MTAVSAGQYDEVAGLNIFSHEDHLEEIISYNIFGSKENIFQI